MSITFSTNLPRPEGTTVSPCLCAQMGLGFVRMMNGDDSAETRADLAREANPSCSQCAGTGVELVPMESPHQLNINLDNGMRLLAALGLPHEEHGTCSIADARRAVMRARNTNLGYLVRGEETLYGEPRRHADGTVEMRPVRVCSVGLSFDGLNDRISRSEAFVNGADAAGATQIHWA